jgi:hypothetical protein
MAVFIRDKAELGLLACPFLSFAGVIVTAGIYGPVFTALLYA